MKTAVKILAVWGCIATLPLLYLLFVYLDSEGIVEFRRQPSGANYYYPADLATMKLPAWDLTNAIPLSPDAAVRAAIQYAGGRHPGIGVWDIDSIELKRWPGSPWFYSIDLVDRQPGRYETEGVRVLLDGSIWQPSKEKRAK